MIFVRSSVWIALVCLAASGPARAWDFPSHGPRLEIDDPSIELELGGRLHVDGAVFDEDVTSMDDDIDVRRGRLHLEGEVLDDWRFKIEYDFAGDVPSSGGWRNVWLGYELGSRTLLQVGNFVAPFGLEDVASSNYATFMERGLSSAIAPSYQTGVGLKTRGSFRHDLGRARWTLAAGGFIEPLANGHDDRHKSEHYAFASRVTFAPFSASRRLLHLGLSVEYRDVSTGSLFRIRSKPESFLAPALISTGSLSDVDEVVSFGAEAATVLGPFSVQAEYMRAMLQRSDGRADPEFDGWYVQGSWILTGERRLYSKSSGVFSGVKPKRRFGAVELALRYSALDLQDGGVLGGKEDDVTVGLNWYLRRNLRLMFNYVHADADLRLTGVDDQPDIFQTRFLVFF